MLDHSRRGILVGTLAALYETASSQATATSNTCQAPAAVEAELSPSDRERHEIFLLLACAMVFANWRIEKSNPYLRREYRKLFPDREFGEYTGHNIGALAVNNRYEIVSFQMNENNYFNSSLEHAEIRAVRDSITRTNARRFRSGEATSGYAVMLQGYTIYTTLESCSQCVGAMDLANITEVIYLQKDPGQKDIGDILYSLHQHEKEFGAPRPIFMATTAESIGLLSAYKRFLDTGKEKHGRIGMTAFLQTAQAYTAFATAERAFLNYSVRNFINQSIYDSAVAFHKSMGTVQ
ncbi:deaminase [Bradyrhizobium pachyrhizi]|uniref:deaminase n=1 Tax=Bradyrhizobium pachyrhizi TaxID=280333 RepID=UPI0024B1DF9C|nr:deaminase [Bradyrhizobium pachyrhizi]WFU56833.1 deaminase [Bradyrhizobium pachyrhizi]